MRGRVLGIRQHAYQRQLPLCTSVSERAGDIDIVVGEYIDDLSPGGSAMGSTITQQILVVVMFTSIMWLLSLGLSRILSGQIKGKVLLFASILGAFVIMLLFANPQKDDLNGVVTKLIVCAVLVTAIRWWTDAKKGERADS